MSCCDPNTVAWDGITMRRRSVLKGAAALAGIFGANPARAAGKPVKLAFCSQLLCIIPYVLAVHDGHFQKAGLEVELVYMRGGSPAMQALVGGAVDYAATALDVALQAYAHGAAVKRIAATGKLPLFALAVAPKDAAKITSIKDLEGKIVGISGLGNADHALTLFLLKQAGADASKVQFATVGTNLLEALRQGQMDAGMVQEPALSLIEQAGGKVLVNAMQSADAQKYLGGNYEFMGIAVRASEVDQRKDEIKALVRGMQSALAAVQQVTPEDLVKALPPEMTTGADLGQMRDILAKYRASLYPTTTAMDRSAEDRVAQSLTIAGLLPAGTDTSGLYDTAFASG